MSRSPPPPASCARYRSTAPATRGCRHGWRPCRIARSSTPLVIVPVNGDQPRNAQRCADLGVGRVVGPDARTPEAIRAAVRAVLADPTYRINAGRVRDEMAALPGMDHAVALLERLAREKQPILSA